MPVFTSKSPSQSEAFVQNRNDMLAMVERMRGLEARAEALSEKRRAVFDQRGQLSPRERLAALLDPGMPFLELFNMTGYLVDDPDVETSVPGATMITGIGYISGVRCAVMVDDSGINAGAFTEKTVEKGTKFLAMALKYKLPFIHSVESGGANLMAYTVELWANAGGLFASRARLSAAGVPVITVLHGPSTAGGAYQPGLSDVVIGVKGNGLAMLAGAALVKAATGEDATDQELGGAEMHATETGLVEHLADDDAAAIEICRDVVRRLDWNKTLPPAAPRAPIEPPRAATDALAGVVPVDYRQPYDCHEVMARLCDGSDLLDVKPDYGPATVCVRGAIMGHQVGIIGNNGPLDPKGATKAAHFLQSCDQAQVPVVFLNNTTGFMVGTEYEQAGMIKHGSKMIQAVTNLRVPKLSLYIGASFGAGNYGMCGYAFDPDFLLTWPNAITGVMGGEQAAITMAQVARASAKRKGIDVDEARLAQQSERLAHNFDRQSDAFYTSGRMMDHGMIDPRDTRKVLAFCIETCLEASQRPLQPSTYGVARF